MKTHKRFEFVLEKEKTAFPGDTQEQVFNLLTADCLGVTPKTKAKSFFIRYELTEDVPDVNDKDKFYDTFFTILQNHLIGTWKWYDSLANEDFWRYAPAKNDFVRRLVPGSRVISEEVKEIWRKNIRKSHEARRKNHELAHAIGVKAGTASAAKGGRRPQTPEEKQMHRQNMLKMYENMTKEERDELSRKRSEAMKAYHQRRREAGITGYKKRKNGGQ